MRMTSNLGDTTVNQPVPKDTYMVHFAEMQRKQSKDTKAPMREFVVVIEDGEFQNRKVPYYTVMMGGLTRDGNPMPLFGLVEFITATGIPWSCMECGSGDRVAEFVLGTGPDLEKGENGLERGKYHCPDCRKPCRIDVDDDFMNGARCKADITVETPEGRDRPVNRVKRLYKIA